MLVPLLFACRGRPPGIQAADAVVSTSYATASDATAPLGLLRHD